MQRGDLSTHALRSLLPELAADGATGCLYVADPDGGEISVYLDAAHLVGVLGPGAADLPDDELAADAVDALQLQLAVQTIDRMLAWTSGAWRFRRRQRPGRPLREPIPIPLLLEDARRRAEPVAVPEQPASPADEPAREPAWNRLVADDDVLESLAKVSLALNDALGEAQEDDETGQASSLIRSPRSATAPAAPPVDPATAARRERLRAAAAAELAAAHAEAEQARRDYEAGRVPSDRPGPTTAPDLQQPSSGPQDGTGEHAEVVDLSVRREAARVARQLAELSRTSPHGAVPTDADAADAADAADGSEVTEQAAGTTPTPAATAPLPWQNSTGDHNAATALLREMAGDSGEPTPHPPAPRPAEPEPAEPVVHTSLASGLVRPNAPGGSADTAALLRELSSLGGDDAPTHSPSPPRPAGSGAHAAANRRRKGLWGRS